ncbi:MAG: tRNA (guanine-N1)-methyltransferase, partial [Aurantibacter sp.]
MKGYKTLTIVVALLTFNLQFAQGEAQQDLSLDRGTIDSQFEFVYKKSGNYRADGKRYEVVRIISLDKLRKNVIDSLKASYKNAAELQSTISGHEATISSLNSKLEETTNNLSSVTEEKDSMSFLGMMVSKVTYN